MLQWESKDPIKWEDKAQVWRGLDFWWLRWYKICPQCGRSGFDPWVRKIPWRSERQPTSVFLLGKSHVQRSLVSYSPWSLKELDTTERLSLLVGLRLHRCVLWTFGAPKRWAWSFCYSCQEDAIGCVRYGESIKDLMEGAWVIWLFFGLQPFPCSLPTNIFHS